MNRNDNKAFKYRLALTANVQITDIGRDRFMNTTQLENYRRQLNRSFQPGGFNFPSGRTDIVPHVSRVRLIRQSDGTVVSGCAGPLFEVA
jgi:hypothetical protein